MQAVRSSGARQPISLGDGAWGIEVSGHDNGYSLRQLAPLVDFIGPHSYPMESDQVRQMLTPAFVCELSGGFGKPVILEEFGVTSDFVSDQNAVDYYTQVLYTTLLAGATGWLAWNNCDYDDIVDQDPYRHHLFELHFGLTDREGKPKPQLRTLAAFSKLRRAASPRTAGSRSRARWRSSSRSTTSGRSRSRPRTTGATSARTSSSRTSRPARPTSRSRSCARSTASAARASTSCPAPSC